MAKMVKPKLTIEQCADQASQCRELALQLMSPPHRITLEHIADTWDRIARDIHHRSSENPSAGFDFKI